MTDLEKQLIEAIRDQIKYLRDTGNYSAAIGLNDRLTEILKKSI